MNQRWFKTSAWLVLAIAMLTTSCERATNAPDLRPQAATTATSYTLVHDVLPLPVPNLQLSSLIGIGGGSISILGHTLTVPAGAVTVPTLFTMVAVTDGTIKVDVSATVTDILGNVLNIGGLGFKKPVTLTLSYARTPDNVDPRHLTIVYVNGTQLVGQASTVNTTNKTVTAVLPHFSKYAMASD